jgi:hypothetical protein
MKAASTSYEADAGPVSAVTGVRQSPWGTTDIAARAEQAV